MDSLGIYETVIIVNDRVEGLLARIDFLSSEMDNPKSDLRFFSLIPEGKRKLSLKDPKLFSEYFPIEQRETIRTHLKPWVETYLQISEVPDQVAGVLKSLDECKIHLDLNLNLSLTQEVLKMVANTASLLIIVFSDPNALTAIPELYEKITNQTDLTEELKSLEKFLLRFQHPVDELSLQLSPYSHLLTSASVSAAKILERAEGQINHQILRLLQSQDVLQTRDEIKDPTAGVKDTIVPFHLAKWAFLTFLTAGSPWDVKDKSGKDGGNKLLSVILTTGWLTNLYRSTMLNYHSALRGILERSKDKYKGRKLEQIKKWEDIALNAAAEPTNVRNRKNLRQKLALLLEEYVTLFEDQPLLIGPRILLILTLLAQATSEINWLVIHQNGQMPRKKKEAEQCLYTTQETVSIIYFSNKLKKIIMDNRDLLRVYIVETLKGQEIMDPRKGFSNGCQ